jgi:16S rRNA (cytosine1402-N4)-methyltransferase
MSLHKTVLLDEAIHYLDVHSNENYIDCTLGGGGHTEAILEKNGPHGKVLALDLDPFALRRMQERNTKYAPRLILQERNFSHIYEAATENEITPVCGILYDLGLSMDLIKTSGRGLSFLTDEPLDMRFSPAQDIAAEQIINGWKEKDLADVIFTYGEERYSRRIAKAIVLARKKQRIITTGALTALIMSAVPGAYRHGRIHCATRTFQALRIAVNDELGNLETSLASALNLLKNKGRIVAISFHSLEDRIVKRFFKTCAQEGKGTILTKKPVVPSNKEVQENPASRSAKLRAFMRII